MRGKKSRKNVHATMRLRQGQQIEDLTDGLLHDEDFMKRESEVQQGEIRDMAIGLTKKKELK